MALTPTEREEVKEKEERSCCEKKHDINHQENYFRQRKLSNSWVKRRRTGPVDTGGRDQNGEANKSYHMSLLFLFFALRKRKIVLIHSGRCFLYT
jgi:hypothetical protein